MIAVEATDAAAMIATMIVTTTAGEVAMDVVMTMVIVAKLIAMLPVAMTVTGEVEMTVVMTAGQTAIVIPGIIEIALPVATRVLHLVVGRTDTLAGKVVANVSSPPPGGYWSFL